ncbi:FAD-dependent oxidoreductase [Nonomuraea sp. NPDC049714]|uniref:FAD-dependent oxidoreductase n=1 Tax=Nonomuraea sp. NPDC049714 TaxID=3364357 RepID=UPI00379F4DE6
MTPTRPPSVTGDLLTPGWSEAWDLVVVGGGPAGVAGALTAALRGLRVALVDSGMRLGGQYFRHRAAPPHSSTQGFGRFLRQVRALEGRADVLNEHQVWSVTRRADGRFTVHCVTRDDAGRERPVSLRCHRLLIATGAHDRPLPFPGWDLPGVLTAGGAQALLKEHGVIAGRRVVVAGTGPFLLPVAVGLADAGARVTGVYEAGGGLGLARRSLQALAKVGEAAGYGLGLARHRVPYRTRRAVIAAHGEHELEAVTVARLDRDWRVLGTRRVACDTLATGYGFIPQIELGVQLGCDTRHDADGSPILAVDHGQRTSVRGVWAAGEPTGVGGRHLAEIEGRIAGLAIAADAPSGVGGPAPGPAGASGPGGAALGGLLRRRRRSRGFAVALLEAYPVRAGWQGWLRDDTLVCRCEEVPLARVREAQELGATDARSIKLLARAGMGWCQGRVCGYAVACLAGEPPAPPRRPVAQPISLAALAALDEDGARMESDTMEDSA